MTAFPSLRRGVVILALVGAGALLTSCTEKADSGATRARITTPRRRLGKAVMPAVLWG